MFKITTTEDNYIHELKTNVFKNKCLDFLQIKEK